MIHYLMIKVHNITGMKYLCKRVTTSREICEAYTGSGKYWLRHLKKHGYNFRTEFIEECASNDELKIKGAYWSDRLDVVNDPNFANLVPELGTGGPTMKGRKITEAQKESQRKSLQAFHRRSSNKYKKMRKKINSLCHAISDGMVYITPAGEFVCCHLASLSLKLCSGSIKKHCIDGSNNKIVDARKMGRDVWKIKTWAELGYNMRPLTSPELEFYKSKLQSYKRIARSLSARL